MDSLFNKYQLAKIARVPHRVGIGIVLVVGIPLIDNKIRHRALGTSGASLMQVGCLFPPSWDAL